MNKIGPNTVCVVTGASAGVGRAIARKLGQRRAKVALLARGREGLEAAAQEIEDAGGKALVIPLDVADGPAVEAAADQIERELGPIDLWVNNAMVSMYATFLEMKPDEFKRIIDVTFMGFVHGTRAALTRMKPRNAGTIIQVGSALAYRSIPLQSAYCAAKHAINGFTESVRSELFHEKINIHVGRVNLPAMNTPQFTWTRNRLPKKPRPTGKIFQPEIAADAVLYAAEKKKREIMLAWPTVEATLGEKVIPGLLDHYLAHAAWEGAMTDEPADASQPDNLFEPVPQDFGSRGRFNDQAKAFSLEWFLAKNRNGLLLGAASLLGAAFITRAAQRGK